jgi:hypothetical protein
MKNKNFTVLRFLTINNKNSSRRKTKLINKNVLDQQDRVQKKPILAPMA